MTAEDADAGVNAELRYSVASTDGLRMAMEPRLGQLRLPPGSDALLTPGKHELTVSWTLLRSSLHDSAHHELYTTQLTVSYTRLS